MRNLPINDFLAISAGAILGANARWVISRFAARILSPVFPYGTLFINVTGSFVVGFFMIWSSERVLLDPRWRLLIVVGFCGAFTTFSSFAFETMAYFEQGQWVMMLANFISKQSALPWSSARRDGTGPGSVGWQSNEVLRHRNCAAGIEARR